MAKLPQYVKKSQRVSRIKKRPRNPQLNSASNMSVSGKAFPVSLMTDLKWGYTRNVSIGPGFSQTIRFRANSVYDPDFTTGATQTSAYGLDIFAGAYQKYEVKALTIDVRMAPLNGGQILTAGICFITGVDSSPTGGDALMARALTGTNQTFSQGHPFIFKRRFRLAELNQILPSLRQSSIGSNPPIDELLALVVLNPNTTEVAVWKTVKIIYHVQFSDRRQVTAINV